MRPLRKYPPKGSGMYCLHVLSGKLTSSLCSFLGMGTGNSKSLLGWVWFGVVPCHAVW